MLITESWKSVTPQYSTNVAGLTIDEWEYYTWTDRTPCHSVMLYPKPYNVSDSPGARIALCCSKSKVYISMLYISVGLWTQWMGIWVLPVVVVRFPSVNPICWYEPATSWASSCSTEKLTSVTWPWRACARWPAPSSPTKPWRRTSKLSSMP